MRPSTFVTCALALALAVVPTVLLFFGLAAMANFGYWTHEYWHPANWEEGCRVMFGLGALVWWGVVIASLVSHLEDEARHD